jgi:putative transposase
MSSKNRPNRRSHRLPEYDYSHPGAYFVTVLVKDRQCVFGEIFDEVVHLSAVGEIIEEIWKHIPQHHENVELDEFVVMPNHLHGIIWLVEDKDSLVRAQPAAPLRQHDYKGPFAGSLGAIVRSFKSAATKRINQHNNTPGSPLWHRNYFDRVIRDEDELHNTRLYIRSNPSLWPKDEENPALR